MVIIKNKHKKKEKRIQIKMGTLPMDKGSF
jgi:hypothetical protein